MSFASRPIPLIRHAAALAAVLAAASFATNAAAVNNEPVACLDPDPANWPASSKPYFMLILDSSSSMNKTVTVGGNPVNPSCAGYPTTESGHARCAVKNVVQAFSGQVNFGLSAFAAQMQNCNGACFTSCTYGPLPNDSLPLPSQAQNGFGCGNEVAGDPTTRRGANILVPMLQDHYWMNPPAVSNVAQILSWVDNSCTGSQEIWAPPIVSLPSFTHTPLNGSLRDMYRYLSVGWTHPSGAPTFPTPLDSTERGCRSVNVILVSAGDENCDNVSDAVSAAGLLLSGFNIGATHWSVKTHVIQFIGGQKAVTDAIAAAGGTGSSLFADSSITLAQGLASIVGGAISPEVCDNKDNNCNGCTDEGFTHFQDVQTLPNKCCAWSIYPSERDACLATYKSSITAATPQGDLTLLPCTTAAQATDPTTWLCFDPKEQCDGIDNNGNGQIDESVLKCGNPAHCPTTEICDGIDNNCDGQVDEGCPTPCVPSAEICDGCDNDCNGQTDNGVAPIPCGLTGPKEPANCAGFLICKPSQAVSPGTCAPGGGFNPCNNAPAVEICDDLDNDCNGIVDDNVASVPCGAVPGLVYGGNSACKLGHTVCTNGVTSCVGAVGPSAEICDGLDNNCNGQTDEGVLGLGQICGVATPPCSPGTTACVNGAIVCQGGVQPSPEICDGIDNDCDTLIDEAPLADAPGPGLNGCWQDAGNCCSFPANPIPGAPPQLKWCAPSGANCNDKGSLVAPCHVGTLTCGGAQGWVCTGPKEPTAESCDGIDNDCNGTIDDGAFPGVGQACGPSTPPCTPGVSQCLNGAITCVGGVGPSPEICDGIDNDCNGSIDDGIGAGGPCTVPYDAAMYPGDRTHAPCQKGTLECDGNGNMICLGGVGPTPEICDGVDNDCDGSIDEAGNAPDGINGSQNPFPPPAGAIGDSCGNALGECKTGAYTCVNGTFACVGGQAAQPETCDCKDNDCDGTTDNENAPGLPPLCGQGSSCVNAPDIGCQCAVPCAAGEFPCPVGQKCEEVTSSQTGQALGKFCVSDACGDCNTAKVKKPGTEEFACAPDGTPADANCVKPPVCVCKGQLGCKNPCFSVTCPAGSVCTEYGPKKGTCVADNCFQNPCVGCGKICNGGICIDNPCTPTSCLPTQECKPSGDFTMFDCIKPCADVMCDGGKLCVDGACVDGCMPPCTNGEVCDLSQTPPTCGSDKCNPNPCTDGSFCDPVTGQCGNDPCGAILCPADDVCQNGQCVRTNVTSSSSSSSSSGGGNGGAGGGGSGGAGNAKGVWGLATGGGGCACEAGPGLGARSGWALAALGLAVAGLRRRKRRNDADRAEVTR